MSVDLPALGAPISATKPQRVSPVVSLRFSHRRAHPSRASKRRSRGLLGGSLGAAAAFGRLAFGQHARRPGKPDRDAAPFARLRDRTASAGRAPAPIPATRSSDRAAAAPAFASGRPNSAPRSLARPCSRRRGTPRRSATRRHRRGSRSAMRPPARDFGSAKPQRRPEIDRARHIGAGFAPHQIGEAPRQLALLRLRKGREQHFRDREPEHVIAEEFQPLIAAGAALPLQRRDMRQRAFQQIGVGSDSRWWSRARRRAAPCGRVLRGLSPAIFGFARFGRPLRARWRLRVFGRRALRLIARS